MSPAARRLLLRLAPALVVLGLAWLLLPRFDPGEVLRAMGQADWRLVALAVVLNMTVNLFARVRRWEELLRPLPRTGAGARFGELTSLLLASYAASNLLPARAGEALRTVQLHRRHGYPVGALVACQLFEKLVEAVSMGVLALPLAFVERLSPLVAVPVLLFAAVTLGGVVVVLVVARRAPPALDPEAAATTAIARTRMHVRRFVARLSEAVRLLHAPRSWLRALAWSWVSDLADVAMVGACLAAVGIPIGVAGWLLVFVGVNLAIAVPSTPGQVGVFEVGAVLILGTLGVDASQALAFAVLYHAAHVVPSTVGGLVGLYQQSAVELSPAEPREETDPR